MKVDTCVTGLKLTLKEGNYYIGEFESDGACEGVIYKNYNAFFNHELFNENEIVYIPEYGFPDSEYVDNIPNKEVQGYESECTVYTRKNFIDMCEGNIELATALFESVHWQSPEVLLEEWDMDEE